MSTVPYNNDHEVYDPLWEVLPETLDDHPFSYWRDTIEDLIEIREDRNHEV